MKNNANTTNKTKYHLDDRKTRLGFEKAAATYDAHAILQHEIGQRLLQRLDYIRFKPTHILDLGCGTGKLIQQLLKMYPKSQMIGADIALNMVKKTKKRGNWFRRPQTVCANAKQLPFKNNSIDLLISNLMLQWCNNLPQIFNELSRVMNGSSLIMFTTFGPDTLKELRQSWAEVDGFTHTHQFIDMHDVGDALMQAGFTQPVMDMEMITMTYKNISILTQDLQKIGATNATQGRNHGLMGKQRWKNLLTQYEKHRLENGLYPASYEVIYGHAWTADNIMPEKFIPIHAIHS